MTNKPNESSLSLYMYIQLTLDFDIRNILCCRNIHL